MHPCPSLCPKAQFSAMDAAKIITIFLFTKQFQEKVNKSIDTTEMKEEIM